jgi:hypothetical protein
MEHEPLFTVGQLKRALAVYDDDYELHLPGGLTFYRLKQRGPQLVALEVNEPLADDGAKVWPDVKAAFLSID